MAKYRKKPVEVEAVQWDGGNGIEIADFMLGKNVAVRDADNCLEIETLEGTMAASVGDFIIKGVQGEFYPCKPDIFEATYERVVEVDGVEEID